MTPHGKSEEWRARAVEYRSYALRAQAEDTRRAFIEVAQSCDLIATRLGVIEDRQATRVAEHAKLTGRARAPS